MTLGRRYELLMANAAREIPEARRQELIAAAVRWIESGGAGVCTHEEFFFMWGAMAGMQMKLYSEELQGKWGGEILKEAMNK